MKLSAIDYRYITPNLLPQIASQEGFYRSVSDDRIGTQVEFNLDLSLTLRLDQ